MLLFVGPWCCYWLLKKSIRRKNEVGGECINVVVWKFVFHDKREKRAALSLQLIMHLNTQFFHILVHNSSYFRDFCIWCTNTLISDFDIKCSRWSLVIRKMQKKNQIKSTTIGFFYLIFIRNKMSNNIYFNSDPHGCDSIFKIIIIVFISSLKSCLNTLKTLQNKIGTYGSCFHTFRVCAVFILTLFLLQC